jgi:hypothetical protein
VNEDTNVTTAAQPQPHHRENDFAEQHHVYEPHLVGLPPLGQYLREAWRRRSFAQELARTKLRAQNFNTVFGQLWLVLNPLLLAAVYFILIDIIRGGGRDEDFFAHLMAGIFAYYFVSGAVRNGTKSVVSGGRLILNTAFPRVLLPVSAVIIAFKRFVPTVVVYVPAHLALGLPVGPEQLWVIPLVALLVADGHGAGDDRRRAAGVLPRSEEPDALPAAGVALQLAGPLLRPRDAGAVSLPARHQPDGPDARRLERRDQPGASAHEPSAAGRCRLGVRLPAHRLLLLRIAGA